MTENTENKDEQTPKEDEQGNETLDFQKRCEELEKELLYLRAEFENYKRRLNKERDQAIQFSNEHFIQNLLPVYNDFERALQHGDEIGKERQHVEIAGFVDGVKMTYREFGQQLSKMGVEFVGEEGEPFDPASHEALSQMESSEEMANKIVQVVQKGCRLNGRLLNPAKVIVGKAAENSDQD